MRLKVGDLVKGKPNNPYNITNSKSICEVVRVGDAYYEGLVVKIVKHETNKSSIGNIYEVESHYFVPILAMNYIED